MPRVTKEEAIAACKRELARFYVDREERDASRSSSSGSSHQPTGNRDRSYFIHDIMAELPTILEQYQESDGHEFEFDATGDDRGVITVRAVNGAVSRFRVRLTEMAGRVVKTARPVTVCCSREPFPTQGVTLGRARGIMGVAGPPGLAAS